ncbi:hypothetical protein K501DRAFT_273847 [Backusella circina FSU 941]|nr:hypothetical protein K501DRAFT_273847 [Backusella circina FSU 941]
MPWIYNYLSPFLANETILQLTISASLFERRQSKKYTNNDSAYSFPGKHRVKKKEEERRNGKRESSRNYCMTLIPGECSAMAAYLQQGKRIPCSDEIALSGDDIANFERLSYIMSGTSTYSKRKPNHSAGKKRSALRYVREQKTKYENEIFSNFRQMALDMRDK